ncbi:membrane protein [Philodulcilactobacillus myokoensis]|uniref:Membrane protein n=1 Tax=Philodulcilactobacillus myokoensis TaxID=2929573 RepID=A0A9W6ESV4_9LACO|nr:YibE/F family protein [Philodulcilactobacillus myokoensis]GLB46524.1 membrane protein [Philodulcilactobacillus myokoensis]
MSTITALGIILLLMMVAVGGKKGVQSFLSLLFNFGFLYFAIILMAYHLPPLPITLIVGIIILSLTIFLSGTDDNASQSAFISSLFVLILLIILIIPIENWVQVQGFGIEDSDDLEGMSLLIGIKFIKIAISTAILSTLGAIAEASMAIASGLNEIAEQHPAIKPRQLFIDGISVGKQIIGTTLNTLFFGLFGGSLSLFIWFAGLHYSFGNIINDKVFGAEFIIIMFSLIGVIITIPITSAVISRRFAKRKSKSQSKG